MIKMNMIKKKTAKKMFSIIIIIISILLLTSFFIVDIYNTNVETINSINVVLDDLNIQDISLTSFKLKLYVNFSNPTYQPIYNLKSNFDIFISNNYIGNGNFSNISY